VLAVGEDLVLVGQVGAARIDEVYAGQAVLRRDLLRAQVLLDGQRVVGAALDGGVVADDHALDTADAADAGDQPGAGRLVVVEVERGQRRDLEKGRVGVEQPLDALARQQLAARHMLGARGLVAALRDLREPGVEVVDQRAHRGGVGLEVFGARRQPRRQRRQCSLLVPGRARRAARLTFTSTSIVRIAASPPAACRAGAQ